MNYNWPQVIRQGSLVTLSRIRVFVDKSPAFLFREALNYDEEKNEVAVTKPDFERAQSRKVFIEFRNSRASHVF
jgi:hypothetical protein